MNIQEPEFRQRIFDIVNGQLAECFFPQGIYVKNEFATGGFCNTAYAEMLDAYSRLCSRLQTEEWNDQDVEDIINLLLKIGEHLSLKMFEYGVLFGQKASQ